MHTLLQRLLEKRKVDITKLSKEEKKDFDRWNLQLTGQAITPEKISTFCRYQQARIEEKWEDLDAHKNEKLLFMHMVYGKIAKMIMSDEKERLQLEKYLNELIDTEPEKHL
jgi:dephospho-CoA kinase